MASTAAEIVRTRGPLGLWQGTAPSLVRVGFGVGINMVLIENTKAMLLQQLGAAGGLTALSAAITGGRCFGFSFELWLVQYKYRIMYIGLGLGS